jgi:hypothetical protein
VVGAGIDGNDTETLWAWHLLKIAEAGGGGPDSGMPQLQLPVFQEGTHLITPNLGYRREGDEIVYLHGMMPVFLHNTDDMQSFKMILSQFYINGNAKQAELVRAFGINALSLKRWVKKYREGGPKTFYETGRRPRSSRQSASSKKNDPA